MRYSLPRRKPRSAKSGFRSLEVRATAEVPPVAAAMPASASLLKAFDCSPTVNTRTLSFFNRRTMESSVVVLPTSSPSERSTIDPARAPLASSWMRAASSASYRCVPSESTGGLASAAWTVLRLRVGASRTVDVLLKVITPTSAFGGFLAANALPAAMAPTMGAPFMLFDASITRIVAKPPTAAPAGRTVRVSTGWPFSVTLTWAVVSGCRFGSVRM